MKKLTSLILLLCFPLWVFAGIDFDGVDDIVDCDSAVSLDNFSTMTISAWINPDDFVNTDPRITSKANAAGSSGWLWSIQAATAILQIGIGWSGANGAWQVTTPTISSATWQHVAFTYDNTNTVNNPVIYFDGVSQTVTETVAPTGTVDADAAFDFLIGNDSDFDRIFNGQITEVAYWNVILTQAEITQLANSRIKRMPLQIQPANLQGYWPLNDEEDGSSADGDTFLDLSSNTNNGTGSDGANNTGLTARAEEVLSY